MPRINTQVRLPEDLYASLVARAEARDISINEAVIRMLTYALAATGSEITYTTKVSV